MILACVVLAGCSTLDKAAQAGKDWYASLPTVIASNTPAITLPEVVKPATPDAVGNVAIVADPAVRYIGGDKADKGAEEDQAFLEAGTQESAWSRSSSSKCWSLAAS
jgi:hypothetical protein